MPEELAEPYVAIRANTAAVAGMPVTSPDTLRTSQLIITEVLRAISASVTALVVSSLEAGRIKSTGGYSTGRKVLAEPGPGGSEVAKEITLNPPMPDGNYIVVVESHYGNLGNVWVTNKTANSFYLQYGFAGGWEVAWEIL